MSTRQRLGGNLVITQLWTKRPLTPIYSFSRWLLPFCLIMALCSCSRSVEIQPLRFGAPAWQDGEQSIYTITDLEGKFAGTLTIDLIARTEEGEAGWTVKREINSSTKEIVTVEVNERLRPQTSLLVRIAGDGREEVRTIYGGAQTDIELTNKRQMVTYERMSLPSDAYDQRTVLSFARSLPLASGYATKLNSFLPIIGRLEWVELKVVDQEEVSVPAGSFNTWAVTLQTPTIKTEAWIGTEPPFPLVKFIDGRNGGTFELQEFVSR